MMELIKYMFFFTILIAGCNKTSDENLPEAGAKVVKKNPKKGFCITTSKTPWNNKIVALNASWHYSWNNELRQEEPEGVEFVPMIW